MGNFYGKQLNHSYDSLGKKLKIAAKVFLALGTLAGIILAIVMFSKSGDSKDTFLIGDYSSGLFNWLGFGFLLGLPSLSFVHYILLNGLGEVLEILQNSNNNISSSKEAEENRVKARVLSNEYGMYCSHCNNYIIPGDDICSRCHCALYYDTSTEHSTAKDNRPTNIDEKPENNDFNKSVEFDSDQVAGDPQYTASVDVGFEREIQRYCTKCGSKLRPDSTFCSNCGSKAE